MNTPLDWSRDELERHSVDLRQFIDFRQSTLPNGMRIIEAYNSSGLTFTVLPDRGLDIWTAHFKGLPLTWISGGSPHPPDFGQGWLRQFSGGLLTTCGLQHVGPPEADDLTGAQHDLHGNYTRLRAQDVAVSAIDNSPSPTLELTGTLYEATLFGAQLRLERRFSLAVGSPILTMRDRIINCGDNPADLMALYHVNVGFPLVRAGTRLITPHVPNGVVPRDPVAVAGLRTWDTYDPPVAGYPEQVFFHHLQQIEGETGVVLSNGDVALRLSWHSAELPYFTQWKNTRQGIYVCGIEPGNCIPEGRNRARAAGRLRTLASGQQVEHTLTFSATDDPHHITRWLTDMEHLRRDGQPIAGFRLADDAAKQSP